MKNGNVIEPGESVKKSAESVNDTLKSVSKGVKSYQNRKRQQYRQKPTAAITSNDIYKLHTE